jgi:hypothetical protein
MAYPGVLHGVRKWHVKQKFRTVLTQGLKAMDTDTVMTMADRMTADMRSSPGQDTEPLKHVQNLLIQRHPRLARNIRIIHTKKRREETQR